MQNLNWSDSEKKLARRVFQAALETELAEIMTAFKAQVAALATPDEMWAIQGVLARKPYFPQVDRRIWTQFGARVERAY